MTDAARLIAVCRAPHAVLVPELGEATAIDKQLATGQITVGRLGLEGDVQADKKHHGGPDKALYAYAEHEAQAWARSLGRPVPPGLFGENLRVEGIETSEAVIGETWRIGTDVIVEATMPRTPCAKFAHRMGEPRWVRRFADAGLVGTYLRVRQAGTVQAGDEIAVLSRPQHGVTVASWFREPTAEAAERLRVAHDDGDVTLSEPVLTRISAVLGR